VLIEQVSGLGGFRAAGLGALRAEEIDEVSEYGPSFTGNIRLDVRSVGLDEVVVEM
jgi:hypothetical protein